MRYATLSMPMLALLAGACTATGGETNNQPASNLAQANAIAPAAGTALTDAATATATEGQAVASAAAGNGPLSAYVGRYPYDRVGGVTFVNHPLVRRAVTAAVTDAAERRQILSADSTAGPIGRRDGRIISWACEQHNCGSHNWTIMITPDGRQADVCYWTETIGGGSHWYVGGRPMESRDGDCPQE